MNQGQRLACPPDKPPQAGWKGGRKTVATGGSPWYANETQIRVRRSADDTKKRDTQCARHNGMPPGQAYDGCPLIAIILRIIITSHGESAGGRGTANHINAEHEPAEGGRPPVAPCKRSAERSDARSAAWGWYPPQTMEPAKGGRMNGTGCESSCTKRQIRTPNFRITRRWIMGVHELPERWVSTN